MLAMPLPVLSSLASSHLCFLSLRRHWPQPGSIGRFFLSCFSILDDFSSLLALRYYYNFQLPCEGLCLEGTRPPACPERSYEATGKRVFLRCNFQLQW